MLPTQLSAKPDTLLDVLRRRQQAEQSSQRSQRACIKCCCGLPGCLAGSRFPEVITYKADSAGCDCQGWLRTVLSLRGRPVLHALPPLLAVAVMAVAATLVKSSSFFLGHQWQFPELEETLKEDYALLLTPLTFLLVYRLNRSAVRFYDARAAAGKLIETCRVLAGEAVRFCAHDPRACDEICRWVVTFPAATRNFLRGQSHLEDLQGILSNSQIEALSRAPVQTLFCCDRLRQEVLAATRSNTMDPAPVAAVMLQTLEGHIATLTGAMGAMERINNTPLPFAYVAHLRSCLTLYLLGLPWTLQMKSWWSVPMVILISYALLGVEAAAVACERPFHEQTNHLPFNAFAKVVAENVQQILQHAADAAALDLLMAQSDSSSPGPKEDRCQL
ncbi:unnamed protein product [Symbiodinium pilosum]|uniref:Uncharacterized protein n=1 Tax=Symbiodinium pilosum TaxID=2952 RepID=A0A812VGK7_SYMPI|nr:unnamed protein product [Symbiodinium pilosum]